MTTALERRFLLDQPLGEGGMAVVWRAWDRRLKVWRAVKLLNPEFTKRRKIRRRFEAEAEAMASLEHRHIVRVYDVGSDVEQSWIVMELCLGGSLEDWVERHGPMPPRLTAEVSTQIAEGLAVAHAHGIVHRDVKPQNVLLATDGTAKITDFGIAQLEQAQLTRTGAVMGTLGYMAPEQRNDAKQVDARCDVYALGASLYYLLTGDIVMDVFALPDEAPERLASIPAPLRALVQQATAYRRDDRPRDMRAFADALRATVRQLPPPERTTPPLVPDGLRPPVPPVLEAAEPATSETILPADAPPHRSSETLLPEAPTRVRRLGEAGVAVSRAAAPAPSPKAAPLPWVPHTERRARSEEPDLDALYVQSAPREEAWVTEIGASITPTPRAAPEDEDEGDEDGAQEGAVKLGLEYALRELWAFVTQIAAGLLKFLASPIGALAWPAVAVLLIGLIAGAQGASHVRGAAVGVESARVTMHATLRRDLALIDDLASAGASGTLLQRHLEDYKQATTAEAQDAAALRLMVVMEQQLVSLDNPDDPLAGQQLRSLSSRVQSVTRHRATWQQRRTEWSDAASSSTGLLAVSIGLAPPPP